MFKVLYFCEVNRQIFFVMIREILSLFTSGGIELLVFSVQNKREMQKSFGND